METFVVKEKTTVYEKIFVFWIIMFPCLIAYRTNSFQSFMVGDIGLFTIMIVLLFKLETRFKTFSPAVLMLAVSLLWLPMNCMVGIEGLLRFLRYLFSMFVVAVYVPSFFKYQVVLPILKAMAVISALFITLQFALGTFFDFYLSGTLPFWEMSASVEVDLDINGRITNIGRFRGFFPEPGYIAIFLVLALTCSLSVKKSKLSEYLPELIMTIGILVSKSTAGLGLLAIVWLYWLVVSNKTKWLLIFFAVPILVFVEMQFGFVEHAFNRGLMLTDGSVQFGKAAIGRIGNFTSSFEVKNLTMLQIIFGQGMSSLETFVSGYPKAFIYFGVFGIVFFPLVYVYLLFKTRGYARLLTACLIINNFFSDVMFGIGPIMYLPYVIVLSQQNSKFSIGGSSFEYISFD